MPTKIFFPFLSGLEGINRANSLFKRSDRAIMFIKNFPPFLRGGKKRCSFASYFIAMG
jgi:hypothetical protein